MFVQTQVNGINWDYEYLNSLKKANLAKAPLPVTFEENGKPWETTSEPCPRCGGHGRYPSQEWDGICLKCQGKGYILNTHRVLSDKEKAQRERAKARRQAKRDQEIQARAEEYKKRMAEKRAREEAEAAEKAQKLASLQWVGTVGEKMKLTLTLQFCKPFENQFGVSLFQVMEDPEGNKVIYSGSKDLFPEGTKTITGTFKIKDHQESPKYGKSTRISLR